MNLNAIVKQAPKPLDKNDIAKIKELKKKGLSEEELAEHFHVEVWVIRSIIELQRYLVS